MAPDAAFEAFVGLLFERWCCREYGDRVERVVFVNGASGDGGTEVYAELSGGDVIGFQAKWFRESIGQSQLRQIRSSFKTAVAVREVTQFVVAIPHEVHDPKEEKRDVTTERDRWDDFVSKQEETHQDVEILLWDEPRLRELMAELASDGLRRYWFDEPTLRHAELTRIFRQAQLGWLKGRYLPELHVAGQIEDEIRFRLRGPVCRPDLKQDAEQVLHVTEAALEAVQRLQRYPDFMSLSNADDLLAGAEQWLRDELEAQRGILDALASEQGLPWLALEGNFRDTNPIIELVQSLQEDGDSYPKAPTYEIGEQLREMLEDWWAARSVTPTRIKRWNRWVLFMGPPGAGKTHATARAVQDHLDEGKPAILLRGKSIDLRKRWDQILPTEVGKPTWNASQVLDALSAASVVAEVRCATALEPNQEAEPVRALVAIDGLDENAAANEWRDKLGELSAYMKDFPRVLVAATTRPNCIENLEQLGSFDSNRIFGSNAPLGEVFEKHCKFAEIDAPPLLRWALRTPLAISLFAEIYSKQKISEDSIGFQNFAFDALMRDKLTIVEQEVRAQHGDSWSDGVYPAYYALRGLARASLERNEPLVLDEALDIAEAEQRTSGVVSRADLLKVLETCRDRGLLLEHIVPSDDSFEPPERKWEPAYEALTDYLLAKTVANSIDADEDFPCPDYIRHRRNALYLLAMILGREGFDFLEGFWEEDLDAEMSERLQLAALLTMPEESATEFASFVREKLTRNMPDCRIVLRDLIVPNARIPGAVFGPHFVHDALSGLSVAERDLFWSGPSHLSENHGGKWEGYGPRVHENLEASGDDPWDAVPLLLAWMTTSVDNRNRRRIRAELAEWGSRNPDELQELLSATISTNDPQMLQDIIAGAFGALCLAHVDAAWEPVAEFVVGSFFGDEPTVETPDVIVKHYARAFVERSLATRLLAERPQFETTFGEEGELLPIAGSVVGALGERSGVDPATRDLAWYVIPHAIRPFFEPYSGEGNGRGSSQTQNARGSIGDDVLEAILRGEMPRRDTEEAREAASEILAERRSSEAEDGAEAADKLRELLGLELGGSEDGEVSELEGLEESQPIGEILSTVRGESSTDDDPDIHPAAQALLDAHAKEIGAESISPREFAFGFVRAFVEDLGWNEDTFIGDPRGGADGEVLGADIAVTRRHSPATHGSRSRVASFGEKYTWAAVNHLKGYLSERLPAKDFGRYLEPPVDPAMFSESINPAADVGGLIDSDNPFVELDHLCPEIELQSDVQAERANEWIDGAPIPDLKSLLLEASSILPEADERQDEWITLRVSAIVRHADSEVLSAVRASSFCFPADKRELLREDMSIGVMQGHSQRSSTLDSVSSSYCNPSEAAWAPWVEEVDGAVELLTMEPIGEVVRVPIDFTTVCNYWDGPDGEEEYWLPAKWVRDALTIAEEHQGKLYNANGEMVAVRYCHTDVSWRVERLQIVIVKASAFLEALEQLHLNLGWSAWVYREPRYPFNCTENHIRRHWHGGVLLESTNELDVIEQADDLERLGGRTE